VEPTNILPIAAVLSLVTVEYGGWALLTFVSGREGLADWQKGFSRAGHAHTGVLLVLWLVYLFYGSPVELWVKGAPDRGVSRRFAAED
jgi:hypothetical protein